MGLFLALDIIASDYNSCFLMASIFKQLTIEITEFVLPENYMAAAVHSQSG